MVNERNVRELIINIAKGEVTPSVELLYLEVREDCYRIAKSILHDAHIAEDAVSELFLNIKGIAEKCKNPDKAWRYLGKCQKNISLNMLRKRKYHINIDDVHTLEIASGGRGMSVEELIMYINSILMPLEAEIIVKKIIYKYTLKEISDIMKISTGKVERLHLKALARLRKHFAK